MSNERNEQIEAINFSYSLQDFAEDWRGVRRYEKMSGRPRTRMVHVSANPGDRPRPMPSEQNAEAARVSQWFIDRYGDDPDHLYARYMRFTMLAAVFEDYQKEIREAGLPLKDGFSEDLLPVLLKLRVQSGEHDIARFDPDDVLRAIRAAARRKRRRENGFA